MNIFIFCGPLAFGKGGMEKVAASLANFLSDKNIVTVGFFCRESQTLPAYDLNKYVLKAPWFFREQESRNVYLKRILESSPDVFIYFGASSQIIQVISLLYGCDVPIIIHEGSNPERVITTNWASAKRISRYEAAWERELIYSQASAIRFTVPEYLSSLPSSSLKNKAFAFPNAFTSCYKISKRPMLKRIVNVGGLKPNKNLKPLIFAFSDVVKHFPDWELHIFSAKNRFSAGDVYIKELEELVDSLCLSNNVFFRGEVKDMDSEFIDSDIHVITSLSEGLSNAVAEAMVNGVPTIGIEEVPGVSCLIKNNINGILVDRANLVFELFEALFSLISNEGLKNSLSDQARMDSNIFNPEEIYLRWLELIDFSVSKVSRECDNASFHYSQMVRALYSSQVQGFEGQIEGKKYKENMNNALNKRRDINLIEMSANDNRWIND